MTSPKVITLWCYNLPFSLNLQYFVKFTAGLHFFNFYNRSEAVLDATTTLKQNWNSGNNPLNIKNNYDPSEGHNVMTWAHSSLCEIWAIKTEDVDMN